LIDDFSKMLQVFNHLGPVDFSQIWMFISNDGHDTACRGARRFADFKFTGMIQASAEEARRLAAVRVDIRRRISAANEKV
jgi:hypothetical protein